MVVVLLLKGRHTFGGRNDNVPNTSKFPKKSGTILAMPDLPYPGRRKEGEMIPGEKLN